VIESVRSTWAAGRRYWALGTAVARRARTGGGLVAEAERYVSNRGGPPMLATKAPAVVTNSLPSVVPVNFEVEERPGREPFLNVMIPGMTLWAMSGGPNTAVNLTLRLARAGVPVRYISTDVACEKDHELLWNHLATISGISDRSARIEFVDGNDRSVSTRIGRDDLFFGTAWWTVQMIKDVLDRMRFRRFLYLIQDFEPGLYPWSTTYALALETYSLDFHGIVNESLLMDHLAATKVGQFVDADFCERSCVFEPAVDRMQFYPDPEKRDDRCKQLVFYARPQAPRNLYELGLLALKRAAERGAFDSNSWKLRFMGEDLPPAQLTHNVVVEPVPWLDYASYARLLRESHVGLSLMLSPHTGYPVLELAACGVPVVTNTFGTKTGARLEQISSNIIAAPPTVEGLTDALVRAAGRAMASRVGTGEMHMPETWEDVFEPCVPTVLAMIDDCRA
jgi:glycosyltransferase involved in cell wall biosynthesis